MTAPADVQRILRGIRTAAVPRRYLLAILRVVKDLDAEKRVEVVDQARVLLHLARLSNEERHRRPAQSGGCCRRSTTRDWLSGGSASAKS